MNKIYLFIYFTIINMVIFVGNTFAQIENVELKFTSDLTTGSVTEHIALDSIIIKNNTKLWELTLYGEDTTLMLQYDNTFGINQIENCRFYVGENKPNPFDGTTNIEMQFANKEQIEFLLCDLSGKIILSEKRNVDAGSYNLELSVAKAQTYLLQVKSAKESKTIKLLCRKENGKNNFNFTKQGNFIPKQLKTATTNEFTPEDEFTFIGYTTCGSVAISKTINATINDANQTFTFNFQNPIINPGVTVNLKFTANVDESNTISGNSYTYVHYIELDSIVVKNNNTGWTITLSTDTILTLNSEIANEFTPGDSFTFTGYAAHNYDFNMTKQITATINDADQIFTFTFLDPIELIITGFDGGDVEWMSIQTNTSAENKVADAKQDRNDIRRVGNTLYIQLYSTTSVNQSFTGNGGHVVVLKHTGSSKMYIKGAIGTKPSFTNGTAVVAWGGWFAY